MKNSAQAVYVPESQVNQNSQIQGGDGSRWVFEFPY